MQFSFVVVALATLVATAAAQNNTIGGGNNATNTSIPTSAPSPTNVPEPGAAFQNAVSGGLLGAVVAAGLALVL